MRETRIPPDFEAFLEERGLPSLHRSRPRVLQLNLGLRCDLACHHCHVEAGPARTESMDAATATRALELLERSPGLETLDLTGGAPELCPEFRRLVEGARSLGREVIDRCNLTVLFQPGQEDTAAFLARNHVRVVASLPCYTRENVDAQRGSDVFRRSIEGLRLLNGLGYGQDPPLLLDLVYNPQGASLPPSQAELEARYRAELSELFGVGFHRLIAITNMPIKRFARRLAREGRDAQYAALLVDHFNPETLPSLMCRDTLSVRWDGSVYDCDFNQVLELPLSGAGGSIWDLQDASALEGLPIATGRHCFGCTAGAGSSCGGALTASAAPAAIR